jgi:hypothetical protein
MKKIILMVVFLVLLVGVVNAAPEIGAALCSDGIDNDLGWGTDCEDYKCWPEAICRGAVCDIGETVYWSYVLPEQQNLLTNGYAPGNSFESCCGANLCAMPTGCQPFDDTILMGAPFEQSLYCGQDRNWRPCTAENEGELSDSGNLYCKYVGVGFYVWQWVPAETDCTNGADENGDGLIDCQDPSCKGKLGAAFGEKDCNLQGGCICQPGEAGGPLTCSDGFNNDGFECVDAPQSLIGWFQGEGNAINSVGEPHGIAENMNYDDGKVRKSFSFDTTNAKINLSHELINGKENVTFMTWIKTTDTDAAIISGANSGEDNEFLLYISGPDKLSIYINGVQQEMTFPGLTDGNWHHLSWGRKGMINVIFMDGGNYYYIWLYNTWIGLSDIDPNGLWLGQEQDSVGGSFDPNQAFIGELDEVMIFDRVISLAEVQSIYFSGRAGICTEGPKTADCFDWGCAGQLGPGNATCCISDSHCSNDQVCSSKNTCGSIGEAPKAPTPVKKAVIPLFSYNQILQVLSGCNVVKTSGTGNNICKNQGLTCVSFADNCKEEGNKFVCC